MATQTINTASVSTGLNIADNVTTGSIGLGSSVTSGEISIGTFGSRSGGLTIGGDGATGNVLVDSGLGGITLQSGSAGQILVRTFHPSSDVIIGAQASATVAIGDATTSGTVRLGENVTSGAISIGGSIASGGTIDIGTADTGSTITLGTNATIWAGAAPGTIRLLPDTTATSVSAAGVIISGGVGIADNVIVGTTIDVPTIVAATSISVPTLSCTSIEGTASTTTMLIGNNLDGLGRIELGNVLNDCVIELNTTDNININGPFFRVLGTTEATTLTNGCMNVKGGVGIEKNIVMGGDLLTGSATTAVSLVDNNTTGDIGMGLSLTTGDINLGNTSATGQVHVRNAGEDAIQCWGGILATDLMHSWQGYSRSFGEVTQLTSQTTGVTLNTWAGVVTTVSLSVNNNNSIDFTITNSKVLSTSVIQCWIARYSGLSTNVPVAFPRTISNGSFVCRITNGGSAGLNNSAKIGFEIMNGSTYI